MHDQCHTNRVLKVSTEMQHFGKPLEDLGEWEKIIFTSIIFLYGMSNPLMLLFLQSFFFLHFDGLNTFNLLFPS